MWCILKIWFTHRRKRSKALFAFFTSPRFVENHNVHPNQRSHFERWGLFPSLWAGQTAAFSAWQIPRPPFRQAHQHHSLHTNPEGRTACAWENHVPWVLSTTLSLFAWCCPAGQTREMVCWVYLNKMCRLWFVSIIIQHSALEREGLLDQSIPNNAVI